MKANTIVMIFAGVSVILFPALIGYKLWSDWTKIDKHALPENFLPIDLEELEGGESEEPLDLIVPPRRPGKGKKSRKKPQHSVHVDLHDLREARIKWANDCGKKSAEIWKYKADLKLREKYGNISA